MTKQEEIKEGIAVDTKYICGRCGGRIVCISEEGTEVAKSYGVDMVTRIYCQHCDDIPDTQAVKPLIKD